ncbi:hypothetical protein QBC41DRAFT_23981 [Cercophora samala]|uniref:Secreted protein n=1 Tax=Cercophora samala TaxID=330535 RepID=A0AA39Z501_9PEZI|nr:hypothetical protein QBC41DRAFT_23981 [Cercophora samala]
MLTSLVSGMLLAATSVMAIPASLQGLISTDITWTGQVVANGPMVNFTGPSLRIIEQQIAAVYPGFTWATAPQPEDDFSLSGLNVDDTQDDTNPSMLSCWEGGAGDADASHITDGIYYLKTVPGYCTNGAGSSNCGQISCSYNSAILWCNNNKHTYTTHCKSLAKYAQAIVNGCQRITRDSAHDTLWTRGTQGDEHGISVIAAKPVVDC